VIANTITDIFCAKKTNFWATLDVAKQRITQAEFSGHPVNINLSVINRNVNYQQMLTVVVFLSHSIQQLT